MRIMTPPPIQMKKKKKTLVDQVQRISLKLWPDNSSQTGPRDMGVLLAYLLDFGPGQLKSV